MTDNSIYFSSTNPHKEGVSSIDTKRLTSVFTVYALVPNSEFPSLSVPSESTGKIKTSITKQATPYKYYNKNYNVYKCILFPLAYFGESKVVLTATAGADNGTLKLTKGRNIDDVKFRLFDGNTFVDFGTIKSVSTSYGASVSQNGMMYTGFENAYCYDSGVGRTYTISFERANPINPSSSESGDTAKWSNRDWLEYIKGIFKKPQLSTDGFRAFFNSKDKLYPSFDSNVYIANFTIDGNTDTSQAVASTLTMSVGSVRGSADYTEVITPVMHTLTFKYDYSGSKKHTVKITDRSVYSIPYPDSDWTKSKAKTGQIFTGWKCGVTYDAGQTIIVTGSMTFEAIWESPQNSKIIVPTDEGVYKGTFRLDSGVKRIVAVCVGGGGAGGGGVYLQYKGNAGGQRDYNHNGTIGAGGGGDCGGVSVRTIRDTNLGGTEWSYELGVGGEGVASVLASKSKGAVGPDGNAGGTTILKSSSGTYRVSASGGLGGRGGSASFRQYDGSGDYTYDNAEGGYSGDNTISDGKGGCVRWGHTRNIDTLYEKNVIVQAKKGANSKGGARGEIATKTDTGNKREVSEGGGGGGNGCPDDVVSLLPSTYEVYGGTGYSAILNSSNVIETTDATSGKMGCGGGGSAMYDYGVSKKSGNGGDGFIIVLQYKS